MRPIDADNLKTLFTSGIRVYDGKCSVTAVIHNINNAPTINTNNWISVEEQHPNGDRIIVTDGEDVIVTHKAWLYRSPTGELRCPVNYGNGLLVTHWMPLPSPPKEAKENE